MNNETITLGSSFDLPNKKGWNRMAANQAPSVDSNKDVKINLAKCEWNRRN